MIKNISNFLVVLLYIFRVFLPLINPLVATFNKTHAPTSKKYIAQQDIMMPNWSKIIQNFRSHSSIFLYIEKLRKNLNFQSFFPLIDSLVTTFNEMCAPTSKKNVAEQGTVMPNGSKIFPTFWSNPSVFFLYNNNLKYKFSEFFASNRPFGGYFQWTVCSDFQKICIWARYSDAKLIKNISKIWVELLRFRYRKTTKKSKFSESFYL